MIDLGTVKPGSTIRIPFSTFDKDDGSSITQTNYAAADILIYKDGSTTERASTAGFTATTDFDAKTGKQLAVIDLADNTTAGFYAAGSEYLVAIDAVTVDTVTTGGWIARFRIGMPDAILDTTIATLASQTSFTLTSGPAEDDALNGCLVYIHDVASAVQGGFAVVSDYTGSTKTVTLIAGTTFTAAVTDNISIFRPVSLHSISGDAQSATDLKDFADAGYDPATNKVQGVVLVDTLTTYTGNTVQTGDSFARLGAPAGASVSADIAAIEAQTDDIGAAGAGLTAVPWNAAWDAEVQSEAQDALDATSPFRALVKGTADSGTTTTMVDAARTEADADYWDENHIIVFTSGTISGQARVITGFDPATDTITFAPAATQAVGTNTYEIWPVAAALRPTVHGRTLDVSAGGEAGLDWANMGSPTTVVGLTGTTIKTATDVETDTADIQTRLPAALVSGRMDSSVGAMAANTLTASALAADAVTEIQSGLSTLDAAGIRTAVGLASANLDTQLDALPTTAEVLTQVNTALDTAIAELGVAAPTATPTLRTGLMLLYMALRNKTTSTATETTISNNAGTTITTAAQSDDGSTYEKSEFA